MRKIKGTVIDENDKWFTVKLDGHKSVHSDFVLINQYSSFLKRHDTFELTVESRKKHSNGNVKWFHIPVSDKKKSSKAVLGIGTDEMAYQPCIGNLIVKNGQVYKVIRCEKCSDGYVNGYFSEDWWKITCVIITNTDRGKKALIEQIN